MRVSAKFYHSHSSEKRPHDTRQAEIRGLGGHDGKVCFNIIRYNRASNHPEGHMPVNMTPEEALKLGRSLQLLAENYLNETESTTEES